MPFASATKNGDVFVSLQLKPGYYPFGNYFDEYYNRFAVSHHLQHNIPNFLVMYALKLGGTLGLAILSYELFEKRFMKLKKKFPYVKKKDITILPVEKS